MLGQQMRTSGIAQAYGGVYLLISFWDGQFRKVDDVLYLFFEVTETEPVTFQVQCHSRSHISGTFFSCALPFGFPRPPRAHSQLNCIESRHPNDRGCRGSRNPREHSTIRLGIGVVRWPMFMSPWQALSMRLPLLFRLEDVQATPVFASAPTTNTLCLARNLLAVLAKRRRARWSQGSDQRVTLLRQQPPFTRA